MNAATFLREARWANDTYRAGAAGSGDPDRLQAFFRKAHLGRLHREHGVWLPQQRLSPPDAARGRKLDSSFAHHATGPLNNQGKVHLLLGLGPVPPLGQVYQYVFERILGEKISTSPVASDGK